VVVLVATLIVAGLLAGACGSSREGGRVYATPLQRGGVGIVYDPKVWTRPPASFRAFFSRGATGRVAMIDSPVLGLQIGALALGYREPLALSDARLVQVTALYEKRRDNFSVFWRRLSGLLRAFRSGEVTLAAATESDALWLREQGIPVEFAAGVLLTTADAQRAATVVRPADAAWLIAWTKAKQPAQPGCG
jgi:spermidine/putrescine-binding protein